MTVTAPLHREVATDAGVLLLPEGCGVTNALERWGRWEVEETREIARLLGPGGTFLDVGAHVGYHLLGAARRVGPGGRAIGVEADPRNFALLAENVRRSLMPWVEVHHAAAWHSPGELHVVRHEGNTGDSRVRPGDGEVATPAARVDDLIGPETVVDLVLLDTQGSEQHALAGLSGLIERCAPPLLVEFWPEGIEWRGERPGERPRDVLAAYRELGYELRILGAGDELVTDSDVLRAAARTLGGFVTLALTMPPAARPARPPRELALSVCIPTHAGRAGTLRLAIDSVLHQITPDLEGRVEVVVSHGGEDADTAAVLAERASIVHRRAERDHGFAWHLLDAVEHAGGAWCWPMSSDDALEPGALRRALEATAADPGLSGVSVSFEPYDAELAAPLAAPFQFIYPADETRARTYTDVQALLADLGVLLGYFPAHLVRRDAWTAAARRAGGADGLSRYFPHLDLIAAIVAGGGRWAWLGRRLVRNRTGNDSWTPRAFGGVPARYWRAIVADLARCYARAVGRGHVRRDLLERWRLGVLGNRMLVNYKAHAGHGTGDDARLALTLTRLYAGRPGFWRSTAPALALPYPLARRVARRAAPPLVAPELAPPEQAQSAAVDPVAALRVEVERAGFWSHSIDLGDGVVSPGAMGDLATMEANLAALRLLDLRGRTVLDVAARDGYYAFAAERLGAARVVAVDGTPWRYDASGSPLRAGDALPGRAPFDLAYRRLASSVETVLLDFATDDVSTLGVHDVVLCLDVLQAVEDPLRAVRQLLAVTGDTLILSVDALEYPGFEAMGLVALDPDGDPHRLWAPSAEGLRELCLGAGFDEVEVVCGPPDFGFAAEPVRYRAVIHARRAR